MTETLLHVTARTRGPARLDDPEIEAPDPSVDALAAQAGALSAVVVAGGEPTLRADLPALLGAVPSPTLRTDALALALPATLRALRDAGMQKLRVVLHSARPNAHDWIAMQPGAARRAMRALLSAAELGIPTEIEATLTRPTAPSIAELVVLAEGVGARAVHIVRLEHRGPAARDAIMLVPRLAQLEGPLDDAHAAAIRARITLSVHGFPRCVAAHSASAIAAPDARTHRFVDDPAWAAIGRAYAIAHADRCASCPGLPSCAGAPADYLARFGSTELLSERPRAERARVDAPPGAAPSSVAARGGRTPVTRLRDVRAIIRRGGVEGDPLIDRPETAPDVLRLSFAPITTSTRVLRARLIRAVQEGAGVLRVSGGFDHPSVAELLRECARLPGVAVELAGVLRPLHALTDAQLFEVEGITRALTALGDPSEIDEANAFLERARTIAKIATARYVVLRSNDDAPRWTDAFARLGDGAFVRLAGSGSLDALAAFARTLPAGAYRDALASVLPSARVDGTRVDAPEAPPAFVDAIVVSAPVLDDEPYGAFDAGIARGWRSGS